MFFRRNRKVASLLAVCIILFVASIVYKHGKARTDADHMNEVRKSETISREHVTGKAGKNQIESDRANTEQRTTTSIRQRKLHINQSVASPDDRPQDSTRKSGQTYYKWNDARRSGWKNLPLKRFGNGSLVPSGLTVEEARKAVIYTRVPKTGSRFMLDLIKKTADLNQFYMIYSIVYNHSGIHDKTNFAKVVGRIQTPFLLARQLFFLDFTEFKMTQPTYISIIRDPVSRLESSFNFNRFGDGTSNKWHKMFRGNKSLTLDDCIMRDEKECSVEGASVTIRYFCGQDPRCKKPSDWSLKRAMDNVELYYLIVGLTEDYENTVKVLEKRLPYFFKGVADFYTPAKSKIKSASKKKYTISPHAEKILHERFHLEYKFYNFIKNRLDTLKKELEI